MKNEGVVARERY